MLTVLDDGKGGGRGTPLLATQSQPTQYTVIRRSASYGTGLFARIRPASNRPNARPFPNPHPGASLPSPHRRNSKIPSRYALRDALGRSRSHAPPREGAHTLKSSCQEALSSAHPRPDRRTERPGRSRVTTRGRRAVRHARIRTRSRVVAEPRRRRDRRRGAYAQHAARRLPDARQARVQQRAP